MPFQSKNMYANNIKILELNWLFTKNHLVRVIMKTSHCIHLIQNVHPLFNLMCQIYACIFKPICLFEAKINFFYKSASICATIIPNPLLSIKKGAHEIYKICRLHNNNSCAHPLDISLKSSLSLPLFVSSELSESFLYMCAGTLCRVKYLIFTSIVPWLGK